MFGLVSRKRFEVADAEAKRLAVLCRANNDLARLRGVEIATARRERNQAMTAYSETAEILAVVEDENARLRAQIEAAKPLRDALGHFKSRKDAVMPEIAGRECSFVERAG